MENVLTPTSKTLYDQSFFDLVEFLALFIKSRLHKSLIIFQNTQSTHLILIKKDSFVEASVSGFSLSEENIILFRGLEGFSNFRIRGARSEKSLKYFTFEILITINVLRNLIKLLYSIQPSDKFSVVVKNK